jgi:hypothetical protein
LLGVRLPDPAKPEGTADIAPDTQDNVGPGGKGMSVAPGIEQLPIERFPKRFRTLRPGARGSDTDRIWRHGTGTFERASVAQGLMLHPDQADHGVVEPAETMNVEQYEQALAATASDWVIDEP